MNSPLVHPSLAYGPASPSLVSLASSYNSVGPCTLTERLRVYTSYINDSAERDLYNFLIEIVNEIFGRGPATGWALDKLKTRPFDDQRYINTEPDFVYQFLHCKGYIFKLCYKLLEANSSLKFNLYFSDIPIEIKERIEKSPGRSYYGSRFLYPLDSNVPIGLILNSFEYYMFHFVLFGLKLTSEDMDVISSLNEHTVYRLLCLNYLNFFLPLESSASMILPQLQFKILSSVPGQKQYGSPCKLLNFIKKDVAYKEFSNDKVESTSWILSSETTWRSEVVAFYFADLWLNCNASSVPSINLTKLIRCFIKHLHLYSNCASRIPADNLKLILRARHSIKIYQFLEFYMINWPQDFSFRYLLEVWICYIQPWRYYNLAQQRHYSITESEMHDRWKNFIIRNLLCYTKLYHLAIKRFIFTDICSPRYSIMVLRTVKVFTHPFLLNMLLDIERMFIENQSQHKKWNLLLTECFTESLGPSFKYELMFSEERLCDYQLFYSKLQKSLELSTMELQRFYDDKLDRSHSSFIELMLSPQKIQKSKYTLSEWEDICNNLKSSLIFMEQIIKFNTASTNSSVSSMFGSNETVHSNAFSLSYLSNQSFERNTTKLPSRNVLHKEWEIDPDYLGTLSYENDTLVQLSKYLRNVVESYWNPYILRYSFEDSILAGVMRQTFIRAPMKIFSYEPRNDGSGKQVRTPKMTPPTVSFRWIASYFTVTWIVFLLTLVLATDSFGFWLIVFYVIRLIYLSLKYLAGYSPPFEWENRN